ncbi:MAG: DNA polymerase I [Firmicutes bacterium]|nr:DNA polymerase I [Bacillota bacterium]
MERLLLIDGNSLINRAFYAFGAGGAHLSHNGNPTNATYGFLNMLFKGIDEIKPTHLAVAFDVKRKTFRNDIYAEYKAHRKTTPDELRVQLKDLKEILRTMNITILEKEGFEADDILGTMSRNCAQECIILTADRDAFQLVSDKCSLYLTKTGVSNLDTWNIERINSEYKIHPTQFIDLKALMGDKSDNIPGAKGVGEKTALLLIQEFGSIENLYNNLDTVKEKTRALLEQSRENVLLSKTLATIDTAVPINCEFNATSIKFPLDQSVYQAFYERGFNSLLKRKNLWGSEVQETIQSDKKTETIKIKTTEELVQVVEQILSKKQVALDYDADGFYLVTQADVEYQIPFRRSLIDDGLDIDEVLEILKPLFESNLEKLVFDSKVFKTFLYEKDMSLNNVIIDAKIAYHLLTSRTNVKSVEDILSFYRVNSNLKIAPLFDLDLPNKLGSNMLLELYQDVELPLVDILCDMEKNGAKIDFTALQSVSEEFNAEILKTSEEIYTAAGERFNINSPKILSEILFKKLGLSTLTKTKTGYSTNEEVLQKLSNKHPIIPLVLRYRKYSKLLSTYINGYKNLMTPSCFVHTTFHNTATVTGRLSSSEPNLQNIPQRSNEAGKIRSLFISRFEDGNLLCADYSQIELRILAHFSGDEVMISAFNTGRDIHNETACRIFDVECGKVTSDMRRVAKAVNFGIVYGISAFGLSQSLNITTSEAGKFIDRYFAEFPKIKSFLDSCTDYAMAKGYAKTIMNRRRYLPELMNTNANIVGFGTRAAMNMPMQGSAADIMKLAMVKISKRMKSDNIKSLMIAQIHDELVFDVLPSELETMKKIVKQEMENIIELKVPLQTDIQVKKSL